MQRPDYSGGSLVNLMAELETRLIGSASSPVLHPHLAEVIPQADTYVVLLIDQDASNLPQVQKGMKASKKGAVTLANYQEVRIRHFHQTLDKYLTA